MYIAIARLSDRNLCVRGINDKTVVYDTIFTRNDALDVAEATSLGLPADTQRNPNRYMVQDLDKFAVRCAAQGVYVPGADEALVKAGYSVAR